MRGLCAAFHCSLFSYFICTQGDSFSCSAPFQICAPRAFRAVCVVTTSWTVQSNALRGKEGRLSD